MNDKDRLGSPDRFGYEWSTYNAVLPEHREHLRRWLGSTTIESFSGKSVLDVGCGMGRNPYWYLDAGASRLMGVDVGEGSLESARRNLSKFPQAEIRKCSVYDLESAALGRFDRVTCIGVLHHLAQPEEALRNMWSCVAPGGSLLLWCYGREGNRLMIPFIRLFNAIGSRLPIGACHVLAKVITLLLWPLLRLLPFRTDYYRWLRKLSFKNIESIVFDQMLPHIAHYWSKADMTRLVTPLPGGRPILEFVQGNSWHARIEKDPQ